MPKLYSKEEEQIGQAVANVSSFAMTTDIWTSWGKQAYAQTNHPLCGP